jgi:polyhydroxyalkanoate synthase
MTTEKTEAKTTTEGSSDPEDWAALLDRSKQVGSEWQRRMTQDDAFSVLDPRVVSSVFLQVAQALFARPAKMQVAQARLAEDLSRLWQSLASTLDGQPREPVIEPAKDDRRFKDEAWTENPVFDGIKQYYLLTARWTDELIDGLEDLDPATKRKARFYARQFLSATAPTNFIATNPKVIKAAADSKGETLRKGLNRLLDDLERSTGPLRIPLTDREAFDLGKTIATTPGKVVFQTDLAQLIQYAPATPTQFRRPLLIVPPWINKFYVLDLQPKNSFVRWAVDQGHTVFVLSWVNPDERLQEKSFDDYVREGPLAALDVIREITGEDQVNALGYCIGGTLLASTLAHLAAVGRQPVASATFFTTLVDFADPGEIGVFIDEEQISILEKHMERRGFLEGAHMAQVFNLLRENDLMWSAFINNYLLGRDPPPFDILFWNADCTRMPAMMHTFYLREMYLNNRLAQPDAVTIAGTPIDLRRIMVPTYILATREDHIAPWRSCYAATRLYGGPVRFVLAESGHIAGVINPPEGHKYGYWTHDRKVSTPEAWLVGASRQAGSWWPDWATWVATLTPDQVPAREPGAGPHPAIEDAPGSYVRIRYDD